MSDFKCTACKEDFCPESNPPRLFPDCGHSVCTLCLEGLLEAGVEITCPEDDTPNSLFGQDPSLGLDAFPINFSLLALLPPPQQRSHSASEEAGEEREESDQQDNSQNRSSFNQNEEEQLESSGDDGVVGFLPAPATPDRSPELPARRRSTGGSLDALEDPGYGTPPPKNHSDPKIPVSGLEPIEEEETAGNNGDESPLKSPIPLDSDRLKGLENYPVPFVSGPAGGAQEEPSGFPQLIPIPTIPNDDTKNVTSEGIAKEETPRDSGRRSRRTSATKPFNPNQTQFEEDLPTPRSSLTSPSAVAPPPLQLPASEDVASPETESPTAKSNKNIPEATVEEPRVIDVPLVSPSNIEPDSGPSFNLRQTFSEDLSPIKPPLNSTLRLAQAPPVCPTHNKPKDIVCLTDRCLICHKCALFGDHKLHEYKEIDNFREIIQEKVTASQEVAAELRTHRPMLDCNPLIAAFKQRVEAKRSQFMTTLAQRADEITSALAKRVASVKEKIDQTFSAFGEAYSYIENNSRYLSDKNEELSGRLRKSADLLKADWLDVAFYLDNFYGDMSLGEQAKRLHEQILDFDSTSKAIVDKRLDVLRFDDDINGILSAITGAFEVKKVSAEAEDKKKDAEKSDAKGHGGKAGSTKDKPRSSKEIKEKSKGTPVAGVSGKRTTPIGTPNNTRAAEAKTAKVNKSRTPSRRKTTTSGSNKGSAGRQKKEFDEPKAPLPTPTSTKDQTPAMSLTDKRNAKAEKPVQKPKAPGKEAPAPRDKTPNAHQRKKPSSNSIGNVLTAAQGNSFQIEGIDPPIPEPSKVGQIPGDKFFHGDDGGKSVSPILSQVHLETRPNQKGAPDSMTSYRSIHGDGESQEAASMPALTPNGPRETLDDESLSDLTQHRSINEEDSLSKSFENSGEENLFNNDDLSHSSVEDDPRPRRPEEHPDALFENDMHGGIEDSVQRKKAASFLKKNPPGKNLDHSGIYTNPKEHGSPAYQKVKPDMLAESQYTFQRIIQNQQGPSQVYYGLPQRANTAVAPPMRGSGLQQNFNNRYSQAQISIPQNFHEVYGRHPDLGKMTGDAYEEMDTPSHKKSFLNNAPGRHNSMFSVNQANLAVSQANLASLQIHPDFSEGRGFKPAPKTKTPIDSDYEVMGSSGRIPATGVPPAKARVSAVNPVPNLYAPATKPTLAKPPPKEEMDQEMHFVNKAINISRLQDILAAVSKNPRVKTLNLSSNYINEKGVEMIADRMLVHPTLETILLNGNDIEEEVFETLLKKFKTNKKPRTFFMRENKRFKNFPAIRKQIALLRKVFVKVEI